LPNEKEIAKAKDIMVAVAKAKGKGAIAVKNKMIDAPVIKRAEKLIKMAVNA